MPCSSSAYLPLASFSSFGLAVGLRVGNGGKSGMTVEGTQVIYDFSCIKLKHVVEDHCAGDTKASDDVSHLNCRDGGDNFCFYPLGKIVHCNEKVFTLTHGFGKGPSTSMPT